jgi:hypothetical protein
MSWFKIFSAVLVANLVTFVVIPFIGFLIAVSVMGAALEGFADSLNTKRSSPIVAPSSSVSTAPPVVSSSPAPVKQQTRKLPVSPSVLATNKQTCEFWTEQYRKDGLRESEAYMDAACLRYRQSVKKNRDASRSSER